MGPILNGLIKLQSVENRLRAAKAKLAKCRRNVIIQENQVRSLQNNLEAKKEEIQLTKVQSDRLELELKTKDETIAKLRASLNAAKTNKEYAVLLTQLNTTKADNSKIENQILELMKDIEADEAECRELERQKDEQRDKLEQIRKDSEQVAERYEAEIRDIQDEWNVASETVKSESLQVFKRVAETYDGEALAVIEPHEGRTETYTCGGCFMGITAETVNLLLMKDDIIRCPNCTRILVLSGSFES
ncbi:MAG TPA: C4-type zinc ribbon domain-containing protein [Sedimentisphaerales bacterium]|nr:C4-type zinc ribbon domain-containing protein [Sedimentisphaerales bacterium]